MEEFSTYGTIFEEENVALSNKRSNYMIDKSFQVNFVVKFIILIVSCAILSGSSWPSITISPTTS